MNVIPTDLEGVLIIEPRVFGDQRGFFLESYHARRYAAAGLPQHFVQDNHSSSVPGTLRGLHYQLQHPQGKLVRVIRGAVFDVAVDIRRGSPTDYYASDDERGIIWSDPTIGIAWPLDEPILSAKDAAYGPLDPAGRDLPVYTAGERASPR
jgi:dTDP-4-dehydrorhamnose 3,5-epimerase